MDGCARGALHVVGVLSDRLDEGGRPDAGESGSASLTGTVEASVASHLGEKSRCRDPPGERDVAHDVGDRPTAAQRVVGPRVGGELAEPIGEAPSFRRDQSSRGRGIVTSHHCTAVALISIFSSGSTRAATPRKH